MKWTFSGRKYWMPSYWRKLFALCSCLSCRINPFIGALILDNMWVLAAKEIYHTIWRLFWYNSKPLSRVLWGSAKMGLPFSNSWRCAFLIGTAFKISFLLMHLWTWVVSITATCLCPGIWYFGGGTFKTMHRIGPRSYNFSLRSQSWEWMLAIEWIVAEQVVSGPKSVR